jgi:RNA-directed DNA polymerase
MNRPGESDKPVVPQKPPNKGNGAPLPAEGAEGRGLAKENPHQQTPPIGHRAAPGGPSALERIRQAAKKGKDVRFTALWHHVADADRLREEYFALKRDSAPGVDGQTWEQYGRDLEANLQDLSGRLHRGAYHAKPVRRVYIPKPDGRQRPIGIPALEDKIVQRAAVKVLSAVYETDFMGFSYGFRPARGAHDALDALTVGISERKVNWVLDADIRGFFDTLSHEWLVKFVEHRIADRRVVRHIKKWLNAGVLEDGKRIRVEEGTPQGGSISPLLANLYLHYVFDLWADHWRRTQARGDVVIVRYADDFVVGFQHRPEAERFLADLRQRFAKFNLELHPEKTRLIEFGRYAAQRRGEKGQGKPETFHFLGFTHSCGKTRQGKFIVLRQPMKKRLRAKLKEIKEELRRRLHDPVASVGHWLRSVVSGWMRYYAVPLTYDILAGFRRHVTWLWCKSLRRRSQKGRITWRDMYRLADLWLPTPRIYHPYPWERLRVRSEARAV